MAELLTLARPYAKAIFSLAQEGNAFDAWSSKLALLAAITAHPEVAALRDNPNVKMDDLVGFYKDVAGEIMDEQAVNMIHLLASNARLGLLPEICIIYESYKTEALRRVDVELTAAVSLSESQISVFSKKLKERFGREINLTCVIDPTLIGGAIIRAGDKVIDGSIRGKLYQMAEALGA